MEQHLGYCLGWRWGSNFQLPRTDSYRKDSSKSVWSKNMSWYTMRIPWLRGLRVFCTPPFRTTPVGVAISDLGVSASNLSLLAPGTPHRRFKKGSTNGTKAIGFWVSNHPFFGGHWGPEILMGWEGSTHRFQSWRRLCHSITQETRLAGIRVEQGYGLFPSIALFSLMKAAVADILLFTIYCQCSLQFLRANSKAF